MCGPIASFFSSYRVYREVLELEILHHQIVYHLLEDLLKEALFQPNSILCYFSHSILFNLFL